MQDEVTRKFCSSFVSEDAFCSADLEAMVLALATLVETDIGAIERQHAISRRMIHTRVQTHALSLQALSADFLLRQNIQRATDAFSYQYFDSSSMVKHLARQQRKQLKQQRKRVKKQGNKRGGGGGYRAFLSINTKGQKGSKASWSIAGRNWRALSAEEKAYFYEVGAAATASHRQGFEAFGSKQRAKKIVPKTQRCLGPALDEAAGPASFDILSSSAAASSEALVAVPSHNPDSALQLFDPVQILKDKIGEARLESSLMASKTRETREGELSAIADFLAGDSEARSASMALLPGAFHGVDGAACAYAPRPSTLPWFEWSPPADLFGQAQGCENQTDLVN